VSARPAIGPVAVSPVIYGSMRLEAARFDRAAAAGVLIAALDRGITTFHCSSEYATFDHYCAALADARKARPQVAITHVVKLATPHYQEDAISPAAFEAKIAMYRDRLAADCIDIVQWMLRYDMKDEAGRRAIYARDKGILADTVGALKQRGWLRACVGFPYTVGFAEDFAADDWHDGFAFYVNANETEYLPIAAAGAAAGKGTLAIRPLAAGALAADPTAAMRFALAQPGVAGAVISANSETHLDAALAGVA
jgi:aryl-alcohol dehydrogenase-like predicted oxidoreductase